MADSRILSIAEANDPAAIMRCAAACYTARDLDRDFVRPFELKDVRILKDRRAEIFWVQIVAGTSALDPQLILDHGLTPRSPVETRT
jgi:hypothetical protein